MTDEILSFPKHVSVRCAPRPNIRDVCYTKAMRFYDDLLYIPRLLLSEYFVPLVPGTDEDIQGVTVWISQLGFY
jgi:hypothetical protein